MEAWKNLRRARSMDKKRSLLDCGVRTVIDSHVPNRTLHGQLPLRIDGFRASHAPFGLKPLSSVRWAIGRVFDLPVSYKLARMGTVPSKREIGHVRD